MSSLLPRKYNNPVVIGLGVCVLAAVVVIVLLMMRSPSTPAPQQQQPLPQPKREPVSQETYVPSGKPTLVLFYGDWCGHSRAMLPAWEKVKEDLERTGNIEAVAFDDKKNAAEVAKGSKLPGFRGFPDIRFFPEGYPNGEAIAYNGNRSEESLLKFAYTGGKQT